MLDLPTCDAFASHLDTVFTLAGPDLTEAALTLVQATPTGARFEGRDAFTLVFRSDAPTMMPQRIYPLDHPAIGRLDLFLVPLRAVAGAVDLPRPSTDA